MAYLPQLVDKQLEGEGNVTRLLPPPPPSFPRAHASRESGLAASLKELSGSNVRLSGPSACQGKRYQGMTSGKGNKISSELWWLSSLSLDNYPPHFSSEVGGKLSPCSHSRGTNGHPAASSLPPWPS